MDRSTQRALVKDAFMSALDPNLTKHAYIAEVEYVFPVDEYIEETSGHIQSATLEWTTMKEIMRAVSEQMDAIWSDDSDLSFEEACEKSRDILSDSCDTRDFHDEKYTERHTLYDSAKDEEHSCDVTIPYKAVSDFLCKIKLRASSKMIAGYEAFMDSLDDEPAPGPTF